MKVQPFVSLMFVSFFQGREKKSNPKWFIFVCFLSCKKTKQNKCACVCESVFSSKNDLGWQSTQTTNAQFVTVSTQSSSSARKRCTLVENLSLFPTHTHSIIVDAVAIMPSGFFHYCAADYWHGPKSMPVSRCSVIMWSWLSMGDVQGTWLQVSHSLRRRKLVMINLEPSSRYGSHLCVCVFSYSRRECHRVTGPPWSGAQISTPATGAWVMTGVLLQGHQVQPILQSSQTTRSILLFNIGFVFFWLHLRSERQLQRAGGTPQLRWWNFSATLAELADLVLWRHSLGAQHRSAGTPENLSVLVGAAVDQIPACTAGVALASRVCGAAREDSVTRVARPPGLFARTCAPFDSSCMWLYFNILLLSYLLSHCSFTWCTWRNNVKKPKTKNK